MFANIFGEKSINPTARKHIATEVCTKWIFSFSYFQVDLEFYF